MSYKERTSDVAEHWKVTGQTIRNWMRAYNLPHEKLVSGYRLIQPQSDEIIKKHIDELEGVSVHAAN